MINKLIAVFVVTMASLLVIFFGTVIFVLIYSTLTECV